VNGVFAKIAVVEGSVSEDNISARVLSGLELGGKCVRVAGGDSAQLAMDWVLVSG